MTATYDNQGNRIVEEKEKPKSMEEMIKEEEHREVYNPETN